MIFQNLRNSALPMLGIRFGFRAFSKKILSKQRGQNIELFTQLQ